MLLQCVNVRERELERERERETDRQPNSQTGGGELEKKSYHVSIVNKITIIVPHRFLLQ